ncbi:MAG: 1-(5-phosphoribosyl)-5-amino-4-imidazole-carboxylate carboxylase, partial [Actinomycetota bacterium]|nr:1-(5-phosphoribosyl)-5-amino-4-imidazole-carboxylate carboxylase [Actinomycetota bacterium]
MDGEADGPDARLDLERARRTGDPEVVFGLGKTPRQVAELLGRLHDAHPDRAVLATRLDDAAADEVRRAHPDAVLHTVARAATLGPMPPSRGLVR